MIVRACGSTELLKLLTLSTQYKEGAKEQRSSIFHKKKEIKDCEYHIKAVAAQKQRGRRGRDEDFHEVPALWLTLTRTCEAVQELD